MDLKFKGLMTTGEWVYGLPYEDRKGSTHYYNECSFRMRWLTEHGEGNAPVKNGTICQFIGIFDKHDNEIYNRDIIKLDDIVCEITWSDGGFQMITSENQGKSAVTQDRLRRFEVIGNIHSSPELLS